MIKHALELRNMIELYQSHWQKPKDDLIKDFLNANDWTELECFYKFLKLFYILTKTMKGNTNKSGAEGSYSTVWETLKTMDYLFIKFKQAADEIQLEEASHFKSGIDCGWAKLEDYYVKTDITSVYRATLALHPFYSYDYFEWHWERTMNKPQWYRDIEIAIANLFNEYQ